MYTLLVGILLITSDLLNKSTIFNNGRIGDMFTNSRKLLLFYGDKDPYNLRTDFFGKLNAMHDRYRKLNTSEILSYTPAMFIDFIFKTFPLDVAKGGITVKNREIYKQPDVSFQTVVNEITGETIRDTGSNIDMQDGGYNIMQVYFIHV